MGHQPLLPFLCGGGSRTTIQAERATPRRSVGSVDTTVSVREGVRPDTVGSKGGRGCWE